MKKAVTAIILILLFMLASCAGNNAPSPGGADSPLPTERKNEPTDEDFDNRFGMTGMSLVETEDAYYYSPPGGCYLYYGDKATGEYGVLCSRPECLHDESKTENFDCMGFAVLTMHSLNIRDGKLYYVGWSSVGKKYFVTSQAFDGSDKEREAAIDPEDFGTIQTPQFFEYHRGKFYCFAQIEKVIGGVPWYETTILSFDPETNEVTRIFETRSNEDTAVMTPRLYYFGRYVYFSITSYVRTEDGTALVSFDLRRWDTETEQVEEVFISDPIPEISSEIRYVVESEDRIYMMPTYFRTGEKPALYLISEGSISLLHEFDAVASEYGAETVLLGDAVVKFEFMDERLALYELDGTPLYDGKLDLEPIRSLFPEEDPEINFYIGFCGDGNELFVTYNASKDSISRGRAYLMRYGFTGETVEAKLLVGGAK